MAASNSMLYGYHSVAEALKAGRRRVHRVYLAQGKSSPRRESLGFMARNAAVEVEFVSMQRLTDMVGHRQHQGIGATVSAYPFCRLEQLLDSGPADPFILVLDQIVDPRNLGAIARTAVCAGIQAIVMPKDRSSPVSPAASKASAGALEHLPVALVTNIVKTINALKDKGLWIAGAEGQGTKSLFESDLTGPLAIVIGGEEKGLRPLVKKTCDFTLAIPQAGPIDSLNASVAAGIIVYEAFRQRQISNKK
ncbi:MAG: 23S rRNA (guanosine(2251)-2'-O)-methyltransferase RlmB [Desulfobacteraceae bacterium]|nr:23S rRNA (guanosine(2251)-2'-O)-methyltransferase RlmB [Desulfobacteraceae bacterium]